MDRTKTAVTTPFGETRLRQIARLRSLERDYASEFNALGCRLLRRSIFAMILDCRRAGLTFADVTMSLDPGPAHLGRGTRLPVKAAGMPSGSRKHSDGSDHYEWPVEGDRRPPRGDAEA